MKKKEAEHEAVLDKRVVEQKIMKGEITEESLKKYLKSLPDVSGNAEEIVVGFRSRKQKEHKE